MFQDGTVQRVNAEKIKVITYISGQIVRVSCYKFNQQDTIYPDGINVRKFKDGKIMRFYPNGKEEQIN